MPVFAIGCLSPACQCCSRVGQFASRGSTQMRKSWAVATVVALMVSGGPATAQAGDDWDAQMAKQCPDMVAWMHAKEAEVTADRKAHPLGKPSEPELRAGLLKMGDADQKARNAVIADGYKHQELAKTVLAVDARNLPRIKQIDTVQGFPTPVQVGNDGVQAAFILVQHADRDPAFQAHVLDELKSRPDQGGVGAQDYALLTDRVLLAQHKLQRYGTQFTATDGKTQMQPRPMEDPANADKRRTAIGLPPLADYACMLGVTYRVPAKS
ncbi:DUF6624 domain-containing protein [Rhodanobacter sp. 7MK24]|uniref:DUF6624 domain-containing protein n=1 Tax=Rhodanobacter sp. 7MK24 TaxID=2775922 RepID=UPI00177C8B69|nr:DUF6624 domain-containing protein [Rhodanobacter sp. 7MK24]